MSHITAEVTYHGTTYAFSSETRGIPVLDNGVHAYYIELSLTDDMCPCVRVYECEAGSPDHTGRLALVLALTHRRLAETHLGVPVPQVVWSLARRVHSAYLRDARRVHVDYRRRGARRVHVAYQCDGAHA